MRTAVLGWLLASVLTVGCISPTWDNYESESALTLQAQVNPTDPLDIPVRFFDDVLPAHCQYKGIGIINDQETFQKLWDIYAVDATALPPSIDFREHALLFVYDPKYYNQVRIVGLNVWKGIANPIMTRTNFTMPIGGDPMMRKIREQKGIPVPEPKVCVAFLQILRNREDRPGVTAILVEGDVNDPARSRVIPVPEEP